MIKIIEQPFGILGFSALGARHGPLASARPPVAIFRPSWYEGLSAVHLDAGQRWVLAGIVAFSEAFKSR